ncbi:MAG: c-type cytochrome [Saprospiraceae bacterium]|nr:c-type cytochrome [Saprospiraceae bacterium]
MKTTIKRNLLIIGVIFSASLVLFAFTTTKQNPWVVPAKYKSMKNPTKADKGNLAIGKTLFNKHCKSCHGTAGKGDGPKAMSIEEKIRSFASAEFKAQTPGEIYYKSFIGRDNMPNFEKKLPDVEDRWFIVNYMATFK